MRKPLNTITCSDSFTGLFGAARLRDGQIIEMIDSAGKVKGPVKVLTSQSRTVITVRELYLREWLWREIVRRYRNIRSWLRWKVAEGYRAAADFFG